MKIYQINVNKKINENQFNFLNAKYSFFFFFFSSHIVLVRLTQVQVPLTACVWLRLWVFFRVWFWAFLCVSGDGGLAAWPVLLSAGPLGNSLLSGFLALVDGTGVFLEEADANALVLEGTWERNKLIFHHYLHKFDYHHYVNKEGT